MTQTVPLFLSYIEQDKNSHICVGKKPETLCGSESVTSATQAQDVKDLVERLDGVDICERCKELFNDIRDNIRSEPTIICHRCDNTYSSQLARKVTHRDSGKVSVCKTCYLELYGNPDSGVSTPYDEKEPFYEASGSREYDADYS